MVHPDFAQDSIPRPAQWERPQFERLQDYYTRLLPLKTTLSERFTNFLRTFYRREPHPRRPWLNNFLLATLDFNDHTDWVAHRMLGQGGYGGVGLWIRINDAGDTEDELVVKETLRDSNRRGNSHLHVFSSDGTMIESLLTEAVIQKTLNAHDCENIVHLRGYSFMTAYLPRGQQIRGPDDPELSVPTLTQQISGRYRFYMEYAPYGDLATLKTRYRAWRSYLPEPFLWHVFDSLCSAALEMGRRPEDSIIVGEETAWSNRAEVVHLDIKPSNIFMGYVKMRDDQSSSSGGSRVLPYPTIKLSDFGLAIVTNPEDRSNPKSLWNSGTGYFRPPEQLHYGIAWDYPPNGPHRDVIDHDGQQIDIVGLESESTDPGFRLLASANIWNIGKVMYDLATLSRSDTFQLKWTLREGEYNRYGKKSIAEFQNSPFVWVYDEASQSADLQGVNPYSRDLMELVSRCLAPSIQDRIGLSELHFTVRRHLANAEQNFNKRKRWPSDDDGDDDDDDGEARRAEVKRYKVFYGGNDVNGMDVGNLPITLDSPEFFHLMDYRYEDPSWSPLDPPGDWPNDPVWRRTLGDVKYGGFDIHDRAIRFNSTIRRPFWRLGKLFGDTDPDATKGQAQDKQPTATIGESAVDAEGEGGDDGDGDGNFDQGSSEKGSGSNSGSEATNVQQDGDDSGDTGGNDDDNDGGDNDDDNGTGNGGDAVIVDTRAVVPDVEAQRNFLQGTLRARRSPSPQSQRTQSSPKSTEAQPSSHQSAAQHSPPQNPPTYLPASTDLGTPPPASAPPAPIRRSSRVQARQVQQAQQLAAGALAAAATAVPRGGARGRGYTARRSNRAWRGRGRGRGNPAP